MKKFRYILRTPGQLGPWLKVHPSLVYILLGRMLALNDLFSCTGLEKVVCIYLDVEHIAVLTFPVSSMNGTKIGYVADLLFFSHLFSLK